MADSYDYTITVKRIEEDGEALFVASVKELSHVHGHGATYAEAYEMAIEAIQALQQLAAELGKPFPMPATESSDEWSGRFSLRLPKSLHRKAAQMADEERVSLNQFLNSIIAEAVGGKSVSRKTDSMIAFIHEFISMKSTGRPWTRIKSAHVSAQSEQPFLQFKDDEPFSLTTASESTNHAFTGMVGHG